MMNLTRRKFLALASSAAFLSLEARTRPGRQLPSAQGCVVLDLEEHCSLPESLKGYQSCLTDLGFQPVTVSLQVLPRLLVQARQVVVPAAASMNAALARQFLSFLENGGSVLLESGLAFVDLTVWDAQRRLLRSQFGVSMQPPMPLWSGVRTPRCVPYVDYLWPLVTKVRDFSRVVPVSSQRGEVIAQVQGMTVGVRRKVGKGTMTVLGSPLGPALRAGDQEARRWLGAVLTAARA